MKKATNCWSIFLKGSLNEANSYVDRLSIVPSEFLILTTVCVYGFGL